MNAKVSHSPDDIIPMCRYPTLKIPPRIQNKTAAIVPSIAAHPVARLHRLGVPVSLSTDDTTVSDLSLTDEYERALDQIGLTIDELWAIDRHALDVAFADATTLDRLRAEFDAWVRGLAFEIERAVSAVAVATAFEALARFFEARADACMN